MQKITCEERIALLEIPPHVEFPEYPTNRNLTPQQICRWEEHLREKSLEEAEAKLSELQDLMLDAYLSQQYELVASFATLYSLYVNIVADKWDQPHGS